MRSLAVGALAVFAVLAFACSPIPRPGSWQVLGTIPNFSSVDQVVALSGGEALFVGEAPASPNTLGAPAAALYQGTTNTWRSVAPPPVPVFGATMTALRDGTVLLAGGSGVAAFLFSPATNRWIPTGDLVHARADDSATLLQDGRVLVVGGDHDGKALASCELYDPESRTWTLVKPLPSTRVYQTAALLSDGRVMIAGGDLDAAPAGFNGGVQPGTSPGTDAYMNEEVYDPRLDSWSMVSEPTTLEDPMLLPLHNGQLLVYGGHFGFQQSNLVYLYDPRSGAWSEKATAKGGGIAIELTDGRILFPQSLWTYDPSQDLWMPVTQVPTGTLFPSLPLLKPNGQVLVIANDFSQENEIALDFDPSGFPALPGSSGPLADSRITRVLVIAALALMLLVGARYLIGSRRSVRA